MSLKSERDDKFAALRRRAEKLVAERGGADGDWPPDFKSLLQEFQTYQFELEVQNEELRESQEELALARDRYLDLYDFSPVGYLILSPKAFIRQANLTVADMLGLERREIVGKSLPSFLSTESADRFYLACKQMAALQNRQVVEVRMRHASGRLFWARLEGMPETRRGTEEVGAIRVALSDISSFKEAEEELRQSRERLEAILESTADALLVVDYKTHQVAHANRRFARMWHLTEEEVRRADDKTLIHKVLAQFRDPEAFLRKVQSLSSTQEEGFDSLDLKDGRIIERYSRPLMREGVLVGRVWSFRDVTERKKTERALADSEKHFRTLFEQAAVGVSIVQAGTARYLEVNPKFCDIVGYSSEELLSRTIMDITHPEDLESDLVAIRKLEAGRLRSKRLEKRYIRKDGSMVWVSLTAAPIWQEGGTPSTFVAVARDITFRKLSEEKIRHQHAILDGISRIFREALICETEKDMAQTCLEVAEKVTASKFGFIGEIVAGGLMHDLSISDPGWRACQMKDKAGHRIAPGTFEIHGLYGKVLQSGAFFTNEPAAYPASTGTPEGHPPLTSFLGVPLRDTGKTIGLIAMANREGGYRQEDLHALKTIGNAVVQALLRKRAEQEVRQYQQNLEQRVKERSAELQETGTALNVLLRKREEDRQEIGDLLVANVKQLVEPMLQKLVDSGLSVEQADYLDILTANLAEVVAPIVRTSSLSSLHLTPSEAQVANLIKHGKSTKEIAELLHLSGFTVKAHRRAIRKKLGLTGRKENLRSFLASINALSGD